MKTLRVRRSKVNAWMLPALLLAATSGCVQIAWPSWFGVGGTSPAPQGTLTDPIWIAQAENAEPGKFVLYQHEFVYNQARLNWGGEDHLKQIAARLHAGQNFPVLVERSVTSKLESTEYKYPVHPNPQLDMQRRAVIVQALTAMGVPDAEQRVVVSPSLVRGQEDLEAERSYGRSFSYGGGQGGFGGGYGGGFGGFGGGGGIGLGGFGT
ncbi:MAG: hypothetical protein JNK76_22935 [Planctomycetales bacterium]|nr:hypothetical protein [Planctomycetales bacterium]